MSEAFKIGDLVEVDFGGYLKKVGTIDRMNQTDTGDLKYRVHFQDGPGLNNTDAFAESMRLVGRPMPSTAQPKSRAIGTHNTFPTSSVCDRTTRARAQAIFDFIAPHLTADERVLSVDRIETLMATPYRNYGPLMIEHLLIATEGLLRACEASAEANRACRQILEFATVTGAQSARKDND